MINLRTIKQHTKHTSIILLFALPCLLVSLPGAYGAVYKWVDAEGNVHYGSQKPADANAERLKIATPPSIPKTPEKEEKKDDKSESEDGKKEEKPAEPKKVEPPKMSRKEKQRLCTAARNNKAIIEAHGRIRETDEKGNTVYLKDEVKQQRLATANKDIRKYCR